MSGRSGKQTVHRYPNWSVKFPSSSSCTHVRVISRVPDRQTQGETYLGDVIIEYGLLPSSQAHLVHRGDGQADGQAGELEEDEDEEGVEELHCVSLFRVMYRDSVCAVRVILVRDIRVAVQRYRRMHRSRREENKNEAMSIRKESYFLVLGTE